MWGALKVFFADNAVKLLGGIASLATVAGILFGARRAGRDAERVARIQEQVKRVEVAHDVENKNRPLPDGAAAERLRDSWSRD